MPSQVVAPRPCQTPTTTSTPVKPIPSPIMRWRVGFSSGKATRIATRVRSGVAPLMMPASADDTYCSLNAKSSQPRLVMRIAARNSGRQYRRGGRGVRVTALTMSIVTMPRNSRLNTTPAGVSDSRPILMKTNELPQMRARTRYAGSQDLTGCLVTRSRWRAAIA